MTRQFLPLILAAALFPAVPAADAQGAGNCAPREAIVERLANRYGETRQSIGLGPNNSLVEVYASAETGTWTILVTLPSGMSCLVFAGDAFENLAEMLPPAGSDA